MKRILLFLVLALGGLLALGQLGGGFTGQSAQAPSPVVPEVVTTPRPGNDTAVDLRELPGSGVGAGGRSAPIQVAPMAKYDTNFDQPTTSWNDPVTHEVLALANAPRAWVRFSEPATMRDTAGSPGFRWKGVQIVLYREPKSYTRAEVDALRVNSKTGRRGLERFEITAEEGYETTTTLLASPGDKTPRERTLIRLSKNVVIRDVIQKLVVRTSDVVVDREAGTAEGTAPIEAQGPGYVAHGKGFRLDSTAERLEILEGTEFDAQDLVVDPQTVTPAVGANTMKPRRVTAKGATLIVNHGTEKAPWTDVRMDGGVHVELDGGGRLDAESITLKILERPGARAAAAAGPSELATRRRLESMSADGDVRYEGKDAAGALLTASGPRLVARFPVSGVRSLLLTGRSLVTWRGELAFPGERPIDRIVRASASESLLFGPSDESPEEALVDLVGTARVECGRLPVDTVPQRIAADRITIHLKRRSLPPVPVSPATTPDGARRPAKAEWIATSFAATGGVTLEGSRLSGAAREMKGFDLDQPAYRVTAVGPDSHLEIADDPEPKAARTGAHGTPVVTAAASTPATSGPPRTWMLDRLAARTNAMGSFRVRAGEGAATFAGDSLTFARATGAEIREKSGKNARVTLEGRESRDRTIEAPAIFLRAGDGERVLETVGRTHAVFWVGDDEVAPVAAASSAPSRRVVELRSSTRIDIAGNRGAGAGDVDATLSVSLVDGGSLSARTGGVLTDRLTADTIELALVETLPRPGDFGFALAGTREVPTNAAKPREAAKPAPAPRPAAATTPGRFVVDSDRLTLAVGTEPKAGSAGGLRRVHAEGKVDARGDDPKEGPRRFEADRFEYDATTSLGVLTGTTKRARITLGNEPAVQRVLSPRIEVTFRDGKMTRARFAAPVAGLVHAKPEGATSPTGELERCVLEDEGGPMTIEGSTVLLEGTPEKPVRVLWTTRNAAGKDVGTPVLITTPRLMLTTTSALGTPGSNLARLDANGPGTVVDVGTDPKARTRIVGDTIRFERPAGPAGPATAPKTARGVLHVTSTKGVVLLSQPGSVLEASEVTYDLATGLPSARLKSASSVSTK